MPEDIPPPGLTPTNYKRTTGGKNLQWKPPSPEHLAEMLPQYDIESLLGHGGMGAVYKGRQKSLDRAVAIKILPPEAAGDEEAQFVERFKNEARTMAKMNHPAIVHVYDFGETNEGQLYIVMEFIDGTDVSKMIVAQGKLPPEHALAITAHVCDALHYAHRHQVIHRDIKPATIMINMEGAVKVADFGLAKAADPNQSGLTKTNMAMGTPDFVAPEALIAGMTVDGRADIYAVGVMLYQMLTGNIPRGMWTMPSVMVQTDRRFDAIIARAMQTDREARYQSAAELRRDLDVILTTPQAKAAEPAAAAPQQKPVARGPQKPQGQSAKPSAGKSDLPKQTPPPAAKKQPLGLIIGGAAAVLGIGAFFLFTGGKPKPTLAPIASTPAAPSAPIKVVEDMPKPKTSSSTKSPPAATSAEDSFGLGEAKTFAGHRYQLMRVPVDKKIKWTEAKSKAEAMGAHLAVIDTKEKLEWAWSTFGSDQKKSSRRIFIGASQMRANDPWQWVTGAALTVQPWMSRFPNNPDDEGAPLAAMLFDQGIDDVQAQKVNCEFYLVEWDNGASSPVVAADGTKWVDGLAQWFGGTKTNEGFSRKPGEAVRVAKYADMMPLPASSPPMRDMAVRARIRLGDGRETTEAILSVRRTMDASGKPSSYSVKIEREEQRVRLGISFPGSYKSFADYKLPADFDFTAPHTFELRAVGDLLTASLDGSKLGEHRDTQLTAGYPVLRGSKAWIESFEYALLDAAAVVSPATSAPSPAKTAPVLPPKPAPPADPRLAQLEAGYQARFESDAQKPFLSAVAALNQSYIGNGIARARAAAQAKGSLGEVTALDAEKALIEKGGSVPAEDAAGIPDSLKNLRGTYRTALAKHTAERDAKAAPLLALYVKALDGYITELTKAGKIDEAKKVQALRDAKAGTATSADKTETTRGSPPSSASTRKLSEREVAEWVLATGGNVHVSTGGPEEPVNASTGLPAGRFTLRQATVKSLHLTSNDISPLASARDIWRLHLEANLPGGTSLAPLREITALRELRTADLDAAGVEVISSLKWLTRLALGKLPEGSLAKLATLKDLADLETHLINGAEIPSLAPLKKLRRIQTRANP